MCASILSEEKKTDVDKPLGQAGISVLRVTMSHQQDLTHSQTNRYTSLQHPNTSDQVSYVLICFGVIFLDKFYLFGHICISVYEDSMMNTGYLGNI